MSEARDYKQIGRRMIRPDGFDKVTGRANYAADLALPGMIWGKILRSPHAHAKILSIDTSSAEAMDGVHAVCTAEDLPAITDPALKGSRDLARNILAHEKVLYHGHAVAAVAAKTQALAEEAVSKIKVEYEVLTPVLDVNDAMVDGAPLLHEDLFTGGLPETPSTPSNVANTMELKKR